MSGYDVDLEFDTARVRPEAFTIPPGHIVFYADGDSMRDADVRDGDLVLIRLTQEALNGQIALVEVVDSASPAPVSAGRRPSPGERLAALVPAVAEAADRCHEVVDAGEVAPAK